MHFEAGYYAIGLQSKYMGTEAGVTVHEKSKATLLQKTCKDPVLKKTDVKNYW